MKPILEIKGISKKFRIQSNQQPYLSLRESVFSFLKPSLKTEEFWALKDISFEVMPGDTVGVIGKNGAGKSTLLKVLSKITPPSLGKIIVRGRIASLLEVGTGFHLELSGRENVFMNGSILGMRKAEIQKNFDEIVDFSGVEKFIDTPLKHYSSGMQLRLAFAVAAFLQNEILIIDEVLAVGDSEFQKKCIGKMEDVSKSGRTILFVSHNMSAVKELCKRGILMQKGQVVFNGDILGAIEKYQLNHQMSATYVNENPESSCIEEIKFKKQPAVFNSNEDIDLEFKLKYAPGFLGNLLVRVMNANNSVVCSFERKDVKVSERLNLKINQQGLVKGTYYLNVYLYQPATIQYHIIDSCCQFEIIDNTKEFLHLETFNIGNTYLNHEWS